MGVPSVFCQSSFSFGSLLRWQGRLATVDMLAKNQHPQHYRPRLNSEPPDEVSGMRRSTSNHFRDELRLERGAAHESRRSTVRCGNTRLQRVLQHRTSPRGGVARDWISLRLHF